VVEQPAAAGFSAAAKARGHPGRRPREAAMNATLLAFDTATEAMAVALQTPTACLSFNGPGGAAASSQLLPQVRRLLHEAGIGLRQLQAIAFGRGPGAFTGLRTACAVAQGLALGAALPLRPVDSLLIVAEGQRAEHAAAPEDIDVVMDARMGELYAGRYVWSGGRWSAVREAALYTLDGLHALWLRQPPRCVAGSALAAFGERLCSGGALRCTTETDRAGALMRVAQQTWRDAGGIDAADALPLYLRDKVALTEAERSAVREVES
jgi:tRNA threonylcarbamoyladenosine biosynthesis protein TsaB